MTRRDAAWLIARSASAIGGQQFLTQWARAAQVHTHGAGSLAPPDLHQWTGYKPVFFSHEAYRALDAFTVILIPTDETPGAREAFVMPFIDFVINAAAEYAPDLQARWRKAAAWLEIQKFADLSNQEQIALVTKMSEPERRGSDQSEAFETYRLIKEMTVRAFYTSRVGLIDVLEYKGNAYLTEFPGCNHKEGRGTS